MKIDKLEYYSTSNDKHVWERHPNKDDIVKKINEIIDALKYCSNCGAKMIEADTEAMYYPQVEGITPTVIEVKENGID